MEVLAESYWYTLNEEETMETEDPDQADELQEQSPNGDAPEESADPDFIEVSNMLREGTETASPQPSQTPTASPEIESVDYVPYLENISIQLGVIDIVLVLFLLIFIIKQFVRVPR